MPDNITGDVLGALFEGCEGLIELRALPSKARRFVAINDPATAMEFCQSQPNEDVYFGVATRRSEENGTLENCQHLGAVFVDIDFKDMSAAEARDRLRAFPCRPSIIVCSGGGLHCYWLLREPFDLTTEADQAKHLLRRLGSHFGGDPQAAEPARILRVPGTLNHKYRPARSVTIALLEPGRRYNPCDFDEWLPAVSATPRTGVAPVSLAEPIREGRRNDVIYRLARSLRAKGLPVAAISEAMRHLNDKICVPPLPTQELEALIEEVLGQSDRPDFKGSLAPATDAGGAGKLKSDEADTGKDSQPTQATLLVSIALDEGVDLFHDPEGVSYATVPRDGHDETYPLQSRKFKVWLARLFYEAEGKTPASGVIDDAKRTLEGCAQFDGPEHHVHVRIAGHEDAVYLDLANDHWDVVEVTANGWQVISDAPVRFRRPEGMYALPTPVDGGSLAEIRPFLNAASDDDFCLCLSWLVGALRPRGPYPVDVLSGEQGTAKSTHARVKKNLIDPGKAALQAEPKNEHDLVIAARNSHICAFDNLSKLTARLSDALCRLSTGGGFRTRALYTNDEEALFDAQRPVILNGIPDIATRSDLVDRSVLSVLQPIPEDERRDENEFWIAFDEAHPRMLGALLTAVATALRNWPRVQLAKKPRMADFAKWIVAAEPSLPWAPGTFLLVYAKNRQNSIESLLDGDPIADFLRELALPWQGTAKELWEDLKKSIPEEIWKHKDWPAKKPNQLSGHLRQLAPALRQLGIDIQFARASGGRKRLITISAVTNKAQTSSQSSPSSQGPQNGAQLRDDGGQGIVTDIVTPPAVCDDGQAVVTMPAEGTVTNRVNKNRGCDDGDDGDDAFENLDLPPDEEAL